MSMTRQNVLIQTHAARQQAADVLKQLEAALAECQSQLKAEQRIDHVKLVTGKSSLETAIAQTQRMLESLDRALDEARKAPGEDAGPAHQSPTLASPTPDTRPTPEPAHQPTITVRGLIGPARTAGRYRFA